MNRRRRPSKQSNYFISPQTVFVKVDVIKLNYKMINLSRRKKLTHPKVGGIKPACLPSFLPSFRFILNSFLFLAIFFSFLSLSSPVLANEDLPASALLRRAKQKNFLNIFNCAPSKIFSIKESIFAGFASLLMQRGAASHPRVYPV